MAQPLPVEDVQTLERGGAMFFYRPRVEQHDPQNLGDVQRLFLLLSPDREPFERLIAIGRKRLPHSARRDRFWGYVDLVLAHYDMHAALGAQVYGTKTRGLRHLPAARPFATGTYELTPHGEHTHLRWNVEPVDEIDPVAADIALERDADYIVTIANPDPTLWGLVETPNLQEELFDELELHVTIPTPFPPALQSRFRDRRYAQLDSTEWLNHPGAEVVFVGAGDGSRLRIQTC
jgi:hypothetical protein